MLAQQHAQLFLKTNLTVMFFLSGDVLLHLLEIRLADRKIRVTALPLEVTEVTASLLQSEVRDTFQFLYPLGLCGRASEPCEQMDVVFHPAD